MEQSGKKSAFLLLLILVLLSSAVLAGQRVRGYFDVNGTFRAGNSTYGSFRTSSNGTVKLEKNATVWEDVNISNLQLGAGASAPDLITLANTTISVRAFDGGALSEQLFSSLELPHSWRVSSSICPHVHWLPSTNATGNVVWFLDYVWINRSSTVGAITRTSVIANSTNTAWKSLRNDFPCISGAGKSLGSHFIFRLYRVPTNATDTYGDDAALLDFGLHYQRDSLGSRTLQNKF